ncbi:MAG: YceI family protein [Saprospiraceae bacterium]|nr:YceI family protein [Saprospiraceae bacterium]
MKQFFAVFGLLAVIMFAGSAFLNDAVVTYKVDLNQSTVAWKAAKVTGQHNGFVKVKSGELTFTEGLLSGGSFVIDMTSIDCSDLQGEWKDKLVGHLKSPDFFDVQNYPTSTFNITRVIPQGAGRYKVEGNIEIKKFKKDIRFVANVTEDANSVKAAATFQLDRTDFEVKYGSGTFFGNLGDKTIYDEFDMTINLVASKLSKQN